jgi:hypothetical protein
LSRCSGKLLRHENTYTITEETVLLGAVAPDLLPD